MPVIQAPKVDGITYRIVRAQLIALSVATAMSLMFDWIVTYSMMLGGLVCVVPAAFMAYRISHETADASAAAGHMIRAQLGKMGLTFAMFVAIFVLVKPLDVVFFFGTIAALHSFYIVVPLRERVK